ncbi:hypothetical protein JTE90_000981 [Oedothorax gibbosus]|uniref:limulus clotting factor C n=1 Tax=Oedothorax gibbosus TaxID=931172 RepID=A0AAV6VDT4_9ARAC|nr:hypothetical protein JTE90_000981 [Oedothorax gibbosus]
MCKLSETDSRTAYFDGQNGLNIMAINIQAVSAFFINVIWLTLIWKVFSDCPFPKKGLSNGRYIYEVKHHVNLTTAPELYQLKFACKRGFLLKGPKRIFCHSNEWTDTVPSCLKMQCGPPPSIEHGQYSIDTGVSNSIAIGSTAVYSCDNGYGMENATEATLKCHLFEDDNNAQWKGNPPTCKKKESCPNPGVSPDGTRTGNCCFIGDVLKFTCKEDYELVGKDTIECLAGGEWDSPRPLCRPESDHCELPPPIPHGVAKGDKEGDYHRPYDEVEILCEPGFRYTGSTGYVMCEEESQWEEEFGECTEAFCNRPPLLANGTIPEIESTNMTKFPFNFEVTYLCDKGFRLIGDSWGFCDTRGWSVKSPRCEEIRCPDPGTPEHGSRLGSSFEIGDKVSFKCFTGYELIGSFERYCMPNGQWGEELARCNHESYYCPDPGKPIHGNKNSSDYNMGNRIGFRCQPGFTLLGSEVRECLHDRTWSGEETKCLGPNDFDLDAQVGDILKDAVAKKEAEQAQKLKEYRAALYSTFHSKNPMGRILDLNFPGRLIFYFAFDVSGSITPKNFRRSIDFAIAIVKKASISQNGARAGALTFSSKKQQQFLPLDYETTEGVVGALEKLQYTGGGTSAVTALTEIREELIPLTQAVLSKKNQKSIIFILTDGKANMGGDPQEEAENLKEAGHEIYCIGITNTNLRDSLYKIASDPKEEHVFFLKNYDSFKFLIQEITKGTIDYSECGLGLEQLGKSTSRGRIAGGRKASKPWPWMAALFFKVDSEDELKCGGSIVHDKYILTAAHCLFTKDGEERSENEITVKLGLLNVQNETTMQEFEVQRIIRHPNYVSGPSYDYDIALLKLKRPIEYSAVVRPICLPPVELPAKTTLYKPKHYAVATGWGHAGIMQKRSEQNIQMEDDLKEIILPLQSPERCQKSAQDNVVNFDEKTFTERMFCAGDGGGGNDTCKGDSGGPLMQSLPSEEGYRHWTQVGIVSWGTGCGLQNTYGYYTHIQRLMAWVKKEMGQDGDAQK